MSILTPGNRPDAALDMFSGSQDFAIGTVTADARVVRGNVYSTTYNNYTRTAHASPSQSSCPAAETNSNRQVSDTTSSSVEALSFLHWLLRPFWIYTRRQDSGGKCDFSVSSLDDDSEAPPHKKTPGEVYVYTMLHAGKGLSCWKPEPRRPLKVGEGVVPGDVGISSIEGGFRKIFNLWDDEAALQSSAPAASYDVPYQAPPRPTLFVKPNELAEGQALVAGAWYETIYESDNRTIARFEFHHLESHQQGAVLAMSSRGKLEELDDEDRTVLREFISQYAELLFKYANDIRPLAKDEALYIVTGSIKSENWALAAFRDPVVHPHHVPKLVRLPSGPDDDNLQSPIYAWRSPGTFDSYIGKSEANGSQDQTLFLRGFKLDFSQSFRSQAKRSQGSFTRKDDAGGDGSSKSPGSRGADGSGPMAGGPDGGWGEGPNGDSWGRRGGGGNTCGEYEDVQDDFLVTSFPDESRQEFCHPCDAINKFLLKETRLDFALCHDDDWRFVLGNSSKVSSEPSQENATQFISVQHGVALLSIRGAEYQRPQPLAVQQGLSTPAREQLSRPGPSVSSQVRPRHYIRSGHISPEHSSPRVTSQFPPPARGSHLPSGSTLPRPSETTQPHSPSAANTGVKPGSPEFTERGNVPGPSTNNSRLALYKTQLCNSWKETRSCRWGVKCHFAHGEDELRIARHPKYKTELCRTFWTFWVTGSCPYGARCSFIHVEEPPNSGSASTFPSGAMSGAGSSTSHSGARGRMLSTSSNPKNRPTITGVGRIGGPKLVERIGLGLFADDLYCLNCGRFTDGPVSGIYCSKDCSIADTALTNGSRLAEGGPLNEIDFPTLPSLSPLRQPPVMNPPSPSEGNLSGGNIPYQPPRPYGQPTHAPRLRIPLSGVSSCPVNSELEQLRPPYSQRAPRPYSPSTESHTGSSDIFSQCSESTQPTEYSDPPSPPHSPSPGTRVLPPFLGRPRQAKDASAQEDRNSRWTTTEDQEGWW